MRIFCDTNILLEYLFMRKEGEAVKKVFHYLRSCHAEKVISAGSFYTLTYLIEGHLKKEGFPKEERMIELRRVLSCLLIEYDIECGIDWSAGVNDTRFDDLEDSYQYQSALAAKCDTLLTLNIQDFRDVVDGEISINTPSDFLRLHSRQG